MLGSNSLAEFGEIGTGRQFSIEGVIAWQGSLQDHLKVAKHQDIQRGGTDGGCRVHGRGEEVKE